jgi:hypothetical protein
MEKETGSRMKTASILLALVFVLGFCRKAGAVDYVFVWGEQVFGIADAEVTQTLDANENVIDEAVVASAVYFGPLGYLQVPCTATQGLIGFCVIFAMLFILPAVLTVRWKRKRAVE